MDQKLKFADQVTKTIEKAEKTTAALARFMPNVGGPRSTKRRVFASVVSSQIDKILTGKLTRIQQLMAIRVCSTYKTISEEAANVIAETPLLTDSCLYCGEPDNVTHTLFVCDRWQLTREAYQKSAGQIFSKTSLRKDLTATEETWNRAYNAIRMIIENKENDERLWQEAKVRLSNDLVPSDIIDNTCPEVMRERFQEQSAKRGGVFSG